MQATVERTLVSGVPRNVDVLRWMFKVCKNLWIDRLRSHDVRMRANLPDDHELAVGGESVVIDALTLRDVGRAMAELPEDQRVVLSLVAVEGLAYREAAEVLDVPIGTVMSRLARARAALAARFTERAEHDDRARGLGGTA